MLVYQRVPYMFAVEKWGKHLIEYGTTNPKDMSDEIWISDHLFKELRNRHDELEPIYWRYLYTIYKAYIRPM